MSVRFRRLGLRSGLGFWWFAALSLLIDAVQGASRPLWHNTRLTGSPDPLPPYTVERVFPQIEWKNPLYAAPEPGTDRLWVILQGGDKDRPARIVRLPNRADASATEPVLEMDRRLIYGLTFDPGFRTNGFVYLFSNGPWNEPDRTNHISRFAVSRDAAAKVDPASELPIIRWRSTGHDGGDLAFGLDGMLYITSGDGTSDSDVWDSGQDMTRLLAKLLRIDVRTHPYSVPADNPFVHLPGARPETWAFGFRNPWRMGIDERTGDIWVGQNGQDLWETAHLVRRGDNIGWSVFEGSHPFYPNRQRGPAPIVPPTIEHSHADFRSLTGGVVYYGAKLPELEGAYIYGDYSTGKIWSARHREGRLTEHREIADTVLQIAAFRVDQHGELLVVDHGGGLYRMVPRPRDVTPPPFPTRLSETGLFASVPEHRPEPGLIPYSINAPGWADGAQAVRYMALPGAAAIGYTSTRGWNFTNETVLVQTLSLPAARRIETRLLIRRDNEWTGYSYRWNEAQTDATLVRKEGENIELTLPDGARQNWRIPGRAECLACHARAVNYVLGLCEPQMNREIAAEGETANQISRLKRLGVLPGAPEATNTLSRLADPYDTAAPIEARARAYLHANCSVCHVEAGGGNARMELEAARREDQMNLLAARPQHDSFGLPNAMLVAPGDPARSVLLHRVAQRGRGQMPPLVSARVDERAVAMLREWIASLKPLDTFVREWAVADLEPHLAGLAEGRSLDKGKSVYERIGCGQCHRIDGAGGSVGPDLTDLIRRMDARSILESLLEPSKVVAETYASYEFELRDGEPVTGRVERENEREVILRTGSAVDELVAIPRQEITRRTKSSLSNMPAGMLNVLEKEQILDLMAYLLSPAGGPDSAAINGRR